MRRRSTKNGVDVSSIAVPPEFLIAPAVSSDASGLIALRAAVVAEGEFLVAEPGEFQVPLEQMIVKIRAADGGASSRCLFVARARHQVIGVVEVQPGSFQRNRHVGHLEVIVRADHRGRGVGRALMNRVIEWAGTAQLGKLALAVYAHNLPAIALYRSLGFIEEGRRVGEYRFADGTVRDDLLMARAVGPAGR